jgi:hypothetical protein
MDEMNVSVHDLDADLISIMQKLNHQIPDDSASRLLNEAHRLTQHDVILLARNASYKSPMSNSVNFALLLIKNLNLVLSKQGFIRSTTESNQLQGTGESTAHAHKQSQNIWAAFKIDKTKLIEDQSCWSDLQQLYIIMNPEYSKSINSEKYNKTRAQELVAEIEAKTNF